MPPLTYTVLQIITDALIEIGALAPGEQPGADEAQWAFRKFNYLVDSWQAFSGYVYSYAFLVYNVNPAISPVLIGPSNVANLSTNGAPRPVRIESAALILNPGGSGQVDLILNIRDKDWWARNQVKSIQTNVPTDLYYDPTFPDGSLYFWPVLNVAGQLRLQTWQMVSQFQAITDPIGGPGGPGTMPEGYRNALMLTLAETLLPGAKRDENPVLIASAQKARALIFGNNAKSPRMTTQDWGMPRAGARSGARSDFNWMSGGRVGGPPE